MATFYAGNADTGAQLLQGTTKEWLLAIVGAALTPYGQPPPPPNAAAAASPGGGDNPAAQPWNLVVVRRVLKTLRCFALAPPPPPQPSLPTQQQSQQQQQGRGGLLGALLSGQERALLRQYLEDGLVVWASCEASRPLVVLARELLDRVPV